MVAATSSLPTHPLSLAALVECRLRELLAAHDVVTYGPVRAVTLAPSKRLHASLALTAARAVDLPERIAIELAAGVELIHAFSLVHEDVETGADLRRGLPTVHAIDGAAIAINAGDALHVLAWSVMLNLDVPSPRTLDVARVFALTLERMVAGQARALLWTRARRRDLRYTDYVEMVRGKTGALFAFAAASPAALAGHASAGALYQFGEEVGIALQLLTDVADVRRYKGLEVFRPASLTRVATGPAVLDSEQCDGTERAIELAHHHVARACSHLAKAGIADASELAAFAELELAHLLALR